MAQVEDLFQQTVLKVKSIEEMRREDNASSLEISFNDQAHGQQKQFKSAKKASFIDSGSK